MCLTSIYQQFDPPSSKQITGYKIFHFENEKYKTVYVRIPPYIEFNKEWQNDFNNREIGYKEKYRTGFHVFTSKKDAENILEALSISKRNNEYVCRKVECSDIVAIGTQTFDVLNRNSFISEVIVINTEVIVARKIKIYED